MKNVLVFGATGDTGRYFIDYFIKNNNNDEYKIIASGSRNTNDFDEYDIEYYQIDITNKSDFLKLPSNIYAIVDFAGIMPARMEGYYPQKYIDVNIIGTLNILDFCVKNNVDRILFCQSFGDIKEHSDANVLLKVDMPRKFSFNNDHSVYVLTKNFAVDLIESYHQMYGIKSFIFRLPTIYLWSDIDCFYVDGIKKKIGYRYIIDQAINGHDIEVWGDPSRLKDMIYVKDFCQMVFKAVFINRDSGYYNVGTGIGVSLEEQINGIIDVFSPKDRPSKKVYCPDKPNAPQYIMDISNAISELGYSPKYDYINMLIDMKNEMHKR